MATKEQTGIVTGIPTGPDVDRLMQAFGVPQEGTVITWLEVEAAIGSNRDSSRFQTVLQAWRWRLEKENKVWLKTLKGVGVEVADPGKRLHQGGTWVRSGFRSLRRASGLAANTDRTRLTETQRQVREHQMLLAAKLSLARRCESKALPTEGL